MKTSIFYLLFFGFGHFLQGQTVKILFDAKKAETAGNADWVIDADLYNLSYSAGNPTIGGTEANARRTPTPTQSNITASTAENYWKGALSAWGIDCVKKGYLVETLPYDSSLTYGNPNNVQDLSNYKVFIVCEPNILFTAAEKTALLNFVYNGGGLFMVSDHTVSDRNNDGFDSPDIWNDLMTNNGIKTDPFGFSFDLANISQASFNVPPLPGDSLLHGPMGDVTELQWFNGTTITMHPANNSSIKAVTYTTGSAFNNNNVMCAYARYGNGKIVAFGDSSPCDDGTGDTGDGLFNGYFTDAAGNHQKLLMNATIWLATSNSLIPISFVSFNAKSINENTVSLKWKANESASSAGTYAIQKSTNGVDFKTIATIDANQFSPAAHYCYTDLSAIAANNFYRIVSTEATGSKTYSTVIRITKNIASTISIYPNPASKTLHLNFDALQNNGQVKIWDVFGRNLYTHALSKTSQQFILDISAFTAAMYRIQILDGSQIIHTASFIKK